MSLIPPPVCFPTTGPAVNRHRIPAGTGADAKEGMEMFQILVVEDEPELNRTVCSYLNRNGYEATGCLSANEAYDAMFGGTPFDLILSDIMMPEIDDFEFAKTVRELDDYHSSWSLSLAGYYIVLGTMRFLLLRRMDWHAGFHSFAGNRYDRPLRGAFPGTLSPGNDRRCRHRHLRHRFQHGSLYDCPHQKRIKTTAA